MRSWVRYSVSAYLGLLLAGTIASPMNTAPRYEEPMAAMDWMLDPEPAPTIHLHHKHQPIGREPASRVDS